jgi:hypothetical protein
MNARAVLPGGLIAALLTAAAVLALLVALGIRGDGPLAIGLGEAGGSARLQDGRASPVVEPGVREGTPVVLPGGGDAAPAAGTAPGRRGAAPLRGTKRGRAGVGQGGTRIPSRRAPVRTPTEPTTNITTTSGGTTTRPSAPSTPNRPAVKVRAPREPPKPAAVKKDRVTSAPTPTGTPVAQRPVPAPSAPVLEHRAAPTPTAAPPGGGVLTHVPAPSATP